MEVIFGLGSYQSESLPLSAQRFVNAFFERQPNRQAKSQEPIFGTPGLTRFTTLPEQPVRNMWSFRGVLHAVAGQGLYRINPVGGFWKLGGGISGTGWVSMADNGQQLMVVNGLGGYLVDSNDNYAQIQNPNFFSASTITYFDNYFVFDRKGTNEGFFSALQDGTSYSGLDFFSSEAQPGTLTATAENLELLFLFASRHVETWYDSGAPDLPFQRYAGGVIEYGCIAPGTVVKQDSALFFLGADHVFYRLQGNIPIRVSNHGVERAFQSYGDSPDAFSFTYTLRGHKMVHVTFPSVPASWCFDISTGEWHERESWDANGNSLGRWRGNCACEVYGSVMIGDAFSGNIYTVDPTNFTEDGNTMPFDLYSAPIHADKLRVFIRRLELDMETGVLPANSALNPSAMLRYSKDGGKTWSAIQPVRSVGQVGEFLKRLRWMGLGQAYQWVFRLTITDPVKRVLIATHLDAEAGMP